MPNQRRSFGDYKDDGANWITLASGDYYPDILAPACELYKPVLVMFEQLVKSAETSARLLREIQTIKQLWMRVQLLRVFKKYVCPSISVEMTKRKGKTDEVIEAFGHEFRPINEVQAAFSTRPIPDEAMCALLWEYKDRGKKGYDLTERLFALLRDMFPDFIIEGPERAGQDIRLGKVFKNYPNPDRPVDFIIYGPDGRKVLAIGLARYDSDRGGAQEDDRTGGYFNVSREILDYAERKGLDLKVIFLNDGPGLLLGSMWEDYARLENSRPGKIKVVTLRMVPICITREWLSPPGEVR